MANHMLLPSSSGRLGDVSSMSPWASLAESYIREISAGCQCSGMKYRMCEKQRSVITNRDSRKREGRVLHTHTHLPHTADKQEDLKHTSLSHTRSPNKHESEAQERSAETSTVKHIGHTPGSPKHARAHVFAPPPVPATPLTVSTKPTR